MPSAEPLYTPRLSVVIPVYRDWVALDRCLDALALQTWPAEDFEVLVISNEAAPPPDLQRPGVHVLHQPQGHSYAARNAGIAAARGTVLAFTDADCQPDADWLATGWAALHAVEDAALAGGRVQVVAAEQTLATDFDRTFAFQQAEYVASGRAVTANLFVRRAVIDTVGLFDASLQSSGDFEFCARAVRAGFKLVYAADAVVIHPARDSLAALFRKNRRVAGGFRRREFDLAAKGRAARLGWAAKAAKPRLRYWWRLLGGREKTGALPTLRRPAVLALHILMHYHFVLSVLRAPPGKDQH